MGYRSDVGWACDPAVAEVIDAVLESLSSEDNRFWRRCDEYWNARGGSYTDGGSFIFDVNPNQDGTHELVMKNKFGDLINTPS